MKKFYINTQFAISVSLFPATCIFFIYSVGAALLQGEWRMLLWSAAALFLIVALQIALSLLSEA